MTDLYTFIGQVPGSSGQFSIIHSGTNYFRLTGF